jgi:hypothetical protein
LTWETIWPTRTSQFGGTLDQRCHFKHVSLKQSQFYLYQMSTAYNYSIKFDDSIVTLRIKNFLISLHVKYLYFLHTPWSIAVYNLTCQYSHIHNISHITAANRI